MTTQPPWNKNNPGINIPPGYDAVYDYTAGEYFLERKGKDRPKYSGPDQK
jgi:hypothetical protein